MQDNQNKNFNIDDNVDSMLGVIKNRKPSATPANNGSSQPVSQLHNQSAAPQKKKPSTQNTIVDFDEIDPENARIRREKKRRKTVKRGVGAAIGLFKTLIYICAVLIISVILATTIIQVANDIYAFEKDDINVDFYIPEGADSRDVAKLLKDAGIIRYPSVFAMYAEREFKNSKYYSGEYNSGSIKIVFVNETEQNKVVTDGNYAEYIQLTKEEDKTKKPLNYDRILSLIAHSTYKPRESVRVTIPEGFTVDDIITLLVEKGVGSRKEYVEAIQNYDYNYEFVKQIPANPERKYRLEGYLFPDTYDFFTDESEVSVINKLLSNFEVKFEDVYYEHAEELGMNIDEVITLASILQKEARYAQDFPLMSSIFHKRLKNNYKLESDATILYVINDYESEEKAAESAYNSYKTVGMIPGPISNPGHEAISAAFYPESTSYYYFFSLKSGETVYSKSFSEHSAKLSKAKAEGTYAE